MVAGVPMEEEQMEDSPPPRLLPSPNGITLVKVKPIQSFQTNFSLWLIAEGGEAAVQLLPGDPQPSRGENHTHPAPAQAACPSWVSKWWQWGERRRWWCWEWWASLYASQSISRGEWSPLSFQNFLSVQVSKSQNRQCIYVYQTMPFFHKPFTLQPVNCPLIAPLSSDH